jgi:hypothetical protein
MNSVTRFSPSKPQLVAYAVAALAITLVTGLVYGRWTQRWGPTPSLEAAAKRVTALPLEVGAWRMLEERAMPQLVLDTLQCAGHTHRTYVNRDTGETVRIAMIVGPSGPTSVHIPEICYSSRAYEITEPREERFFGPGPGGGGSHSLWSLRFKSQNAGVGQLQVYYGWSTGDLWVASQSPRFEFGGSPLLYKIEVSAEMGPAEDGSGNDPCKSFINALLQTYWQSRTGRSSA